MWTEVFPEEEVLMLGCKGEAEGSLDEAGEQGAGHRSQDREGRQCSHPLSTYLHLWAATLSS